jgi:hypothetical protein
MTPNRRGALGPYLDWVRRIAAQLIAVLSLAGASPALADEASSAASDGPWQARHISMAERLSRYAPTDTLATLAQLREIPRTNYIRWGGIESDMNAGSIVAAIVYGERYVERDAERAMEAYAWIQIARTVAVEACSFELAHVNALIENASPNLITRMERVAESKPGAYYRGLLNATRRMPSEPIQSDFFCPDRDVALKDLWRISSKAQIDGWSRMGALGKVDLPVLDATDLEVPTVEAPDALKWSEPIAWLDDQRLLVKVERWYSEAEWFNGRAPEDPEGTERFAIWNWAEGVAHSAASSVNLGRLICARGDNVVVYRKVGGVTEYWRWSPEYEQVIWDDVGTAQEARDSARPKVNPLDCSLDTTTRRKGARYTYRVPGGKGIIAYMGPAEGWELCEATNSKECERLDIGLSDGSPAIGQIPWLSSYYSLEGGYVHIDPNAIAVWRPGLQVEHHEFPKTHMMLTSQRLTLSAAGIVARLQIVGHRGRPTKSQSGLYVYRDRLFRLRQGFALRLGKEAFVSPNGCLVADAPRRLLDSSSKSELVIDRPMAVLDLCSDHSAPIRSDQ